MRVTQQSYAQCFLDSILIKLKVTHKNTILWYFGSYFLFLVWFKFHNVFIFLHSPGPHPETTEHFQWKGEYQIALLGWCPLVLGQMFFVAFGWNDIILLVFTFSRILPIFYVLLPYLCSSLILLFTQQPSTHVKRHVVSYQMA